MKYTKIDEVKEEVVELYQQGKKKKEIREILNVSEWSLTKFFKNNIVYRFNEDCFEDINSEEKAYWLGFLWADGNITKQAIYLELQRGDEDHLLKLRKFLGNHYQKIDQTRGNCIRLRVHSKKLIEDLKKLGFGLKNDRINIPEIEDSLIKHFIRGYFDGDGHIRVRGNKLEGCDISGRIDFIDKLNTYINFKREELHSANSKRIYSTKDGGIEFLKFIYLDSKIYLDRKYTSALLYGDI